VCEYYEEVTAMNDFFAMLEEAIKKIFDILSGIFKIFENNEEGEATE